MTEEDLKKVSWYHNLCKAWFISSLLKDCSMALFSIVSIFLQISYGNMVSKIGIVFCILCIVNTSVIFSKNTDYISKLVSNEEPKSLKLFDVINWICFISGIICLIVNIFGG